MNARANDVMSRIAELDAGMSRIDAQLGSVQVAPGVPPAMPSEQNSLQALIQQSDQAPRVDFPKNNLNGGHYLDVWLSNAHSGWQWFMELPGLRRASALMSPEVRDWLDYVAIDVINLPGVVGQARRANSVAQGGVVIGAVMQSDLAAGMVNVMSHFSQLDLSQSETGVAVAIGLAVLGMQDYLSISGNQRLRGSHDAMVEKIDRWRTEASQGWTSAMKGWMAWGASKLFTPHPPLSLQANNALNFYREHGGPVPVLPGEDLRAAQSIAKILSSKFNVPDGKAIDSAIKMLALEERDPNRLQSFLHLRYMPSAWAQRYGLAKNTFVASDILMPNTGHGQFRNWLPGGKEIPELSVQANGALDFLKLHGGEMPALPLQDLRVAETVADFVGKAFGAPNDAKLALAVDLLAHEERSPDELIRRLRAEGLPGVWREKYDLAPDGVRLDNGKGI